jgi:hypothetical protein
MPSFQEVQVISIWTNLTKVDDAIIDVQKFHYPQQECHRRQKEHTTLNAGASSIRKKTPLLSPLLILVLFTTIQLYDC